MKLFKFYFKNNWFSRFLLDETKFRMRYVDLRRSEKDLPHANVKFMPFCMHLLDYLSLVDYVDKGKRKYRCM